MNAITYPIPEAAATALLSIRAPYVSNDDYQRLVTVATAIARNGTPLLTVERTIRRLVIARELVAYLGNEGEHATDIALQAVCDACGATGRMEDFNSDDWTK